jgi:hypothetical protein
VVRKKNSDNQKSCSVCDQVTMDTRWQINELTWFFLSTFAVVAASHKWVLSPGCLGGSSHSWEGNLVTISLPMSPITSCMLNLPASSLTKDLSTSLRKTKCRPLEVEQYPALKSGTSSRSPWLPAHGHQSGGMLYLETLLCLQL